MHKRLRQLPRDDGEEAPFPGYALELVSAAVSELKPGPDHKVAQRPGYKHIVRPCQCAHACADVHADPTDIRPGPRTRRCATRRAPRCRAPAPYPGSTSHSGSLAEGRRTSPESRRPITLPTAT